MRENMAEETHLHKQLHPAIKQRSRQLRQPLTPAEQKLWQILRNRGLEGYKFRRQHPIGRYIVDFYCVQTRLVIEVDGGIHLTQEASDAVRTKWLESSGCTVIRFYNTDINHNIEAVETRILEVCKDLEKSNQG
jgi:very-short-patch-repair endonuclease